MAHGFSINLPIDAERTTRLVHALEMAAKDAFELGLWCDGHPAQDTLTAIAQYLKARIAIAD